MLGLDKNNAPAGRHNNKVELAKQMRDAGQLKSNFGNGEVRYPSQTVAVTLIFALSVILAFLLTDSKSNPLSGIHFTGIPGVDNFITGTDIAHFTDDPDNNKVLTIMGRGAVFFALAGFVPFISFVLERLLFHKRVMPLVICWGVTLLIFVLYIFVPINSIVPFFKSL